MGRIKDVSTGGMFVTAPAPAQTGWQFEICIDSPRWKNGLRIDATVRRVTNSGFGVQFVLEGIGQQMLENILLPNWDGDNMYEGLIIFSQRENVVEFSEWLRLTSLVCNQYRQCARARAVSQQRKCVTRGHYSVE